MSDVNDNQPCCAHSIVKHSLVNLGGGRCSDAWHCCDCGTRFSVDISLPTFGPDRSHLHKKLDSLQAANAALEARVHKACIYLRQVGDDYPGSSCQMWCHERAQEIENGPA